MKNISEIKSSKDIFKIVKANVPFFFVLIFLILAVFLNGINGAFVSDDLPTISENPISRDINSAIETRQIQIVIYAIINTTFGINPTPFHIYSLLMHIVNMILFFILVYMYFNKNIAAISTLFYSIHPVISETVLWISANNYLITGIVTLIILIAHKLYLNTKQKKYLIFATIIFVGIGLIFTNYWMLVIPILMLGIHFFNSGKRFSKELYLLSGIAGSITYVMYLYMSQGDRAVERFASLNVPGATPYLNRLAYSTYMMWELLVFPKNLTLYHEGAMITQFKYFIMGIVTVITFIVAIVLFFKRNTGKNTALYILLLVSVLPIFSPQQVAWFAAERYLYIAAGFYSILLTNLLIYIGKKYTSKDVRNILIVLIILAFGIRSFIRTNDWKTRKSLWEATQRVGPYGARVYNNLGDVYGTEGDYQRSIQMFAKAIEMRPDYAEAYHNLGNTFMQMGQFENAKKVLLKSVELSPGLYQGYFKLGLINYAEENFSEAAFYFQKTLEVQPEFIPAQQALQISLQKSQ